MKAVIMAGGKGTRLSSVTKDEIPKPMVHVAGKPILEWQVKQLKDNGVREILMVIGHLGEKIQSYFGDGTGFGVCIKYYCENTPLGTAGALSDINYFLNQEQYFLLVYGDVIFDIDIERMEEFHVRKCAGITILVHPNSHPYDSDLVLTDEECRVTSFNLKTTSRHSWYHNCVNAGFYIVSSQACSSIRPGEKTDLERDLLQNRITKERDVYAYSSPEYIKDVGTPQRIADAEKEISKGTVIARNLKRRQKCIFLDRDGTINQYKGLLYKEEDFILETNAVDAIRAINQSDYLAIVVTNQPVVARGLCSLEDVRAIHNKMETLLGEGGAYLDDVLFCPHHPDKGYPEENPLYKVDCSCRKPGIEMLQICADRYNIDLASSWMIGDTTIDVETGKNAHTHTVLLETGLAGSDAKYDSTPDLKAKDLKSAIDQILEVP